jgi:hypothetical protein
MRIVCGRQQMHTCVASSSPVNLIAIFERRLART